MTFSKKSIYSVKIKTWVLITGKMKWTPFCAVKEGHGDKPVMSSGLRGAKFCQNFFSTLYTWGRIDTVQVWWKGGEEKDDGIKSDFSQTID